MAESLNRPIGPNSIHLCIDMQRLFSSDGPWPTPWIDRVLPTIVKIAEQFSERTVFTRFIPPRTPREMPGTWRLYYEKWSAVTRQNLDPALLRLMPALEQFAPPATVIDKPVYSAFTGRRLREHLRRRQIDTLVVTGSETDVCVLATVFGAIDHGYRVILVTDGICSSSDSGHDALLSLYRTRFSEQIEAVESDELISEWQSPTFRRG